MKKMILFFVIIISNVSAQVQFDALTFSPQYPKAGEKVTFVFTKNYSPLINEENIDVAVYLFSKKGLKVVGFGGKNDALVEEVMAMVEMASK